MSAVPPFKGLVEVAPHFRPRPNLRHAILDWDGTISLLRGGWVEVMVDLCLEHLPAASGPGGPELRAQIHSEMLALNGKPSIHQMIRISELVTERGGTALTSDEYQNHYVQRITTVIDERVSGLRQHGHPPERIMVHGARRLLELMSAQGIELTVASGTPRPELIEEAALLGIAPFIGDRFHGPRDTADRDFTKRATIHALVAEHGISGEEFVAIGDGPIEISETKALGGLAIAVASDEIEPGSGRFDEIKRRQLLQCGADLVVPDYRDAEALVALMTGKS